MDTVPRADASFLDLLARIADVLERVDTHLRAADREPSRPEAEYLSIKQAAAVAGLSSTKIRREIKAGRLPASDIGTPAHPHYRIARSDLQAWMEKNRGGSNVPLQPQRLKRKIKSRYFGEM